VHVMAEVIKVDVCLGQMVRAGLHGLIFSLWWNTRTDVALFDIR
jgi:hypothetical protein